jgi:hypothetical protein
MSYLQVAGVVSALCALLCAGAAVAAGAGTAGSGPTPASPGPTAATLPSVEIVNQQSHLAGTCGGATFDINTFINVDNQASTDVKLSVPSAGVIEEFTDETGSNVGPFRGNYPTFHILSFGGGLPPNTPILLTLTTYTGHSLSGVVSFVSTLQFDCTTGTILTLSGGASDAAPPIPALGDAALAALSGMLALMSVWALRRRRVLARR